jgi:hypothetical protein
MEILVSLIVEQSSKSIVSREHHEFRTSGSHSAKELIVVINPHSSKAQVQAVQHRYWKCILRLRALIRQLICFEDVIGVARV